MNDEDRQTFETLIHGMEVAEGRELVLAGFQTALAYRDAQLITLTQQRDEAVRERDLAIAHDRQPYPTADAYEKACKALHQKTGRINELAAVVAACRESFAPYLNAISPHPDLRDLANQCDAALTCLEAPSGHWITIKPDGSNLPEHMEGAEWWVVIDSDTQPRTERWVDWTPEDWEEITDRAYDGSVWAYWSTPHIDRRPDIPAYQPEQEQGDAKSV